MNSFLDYYYSDTFKNIEGGNVFELFGKFYDGDLRPIESWLEIQFRRKVVKNNNISAEHRRTGNAHYAERDLMISLEFYTKSLCFATPYSQEYGLALANRSAVSFEMKEYQNCIKDIDMCFKTTYPMKLRPKIYLRKAECCLELNQEEASRKCILEIRLLLESKCIQDKDKFLIKLSQIEKMKPSQSKCNRSIDNFYQVPGLSEDENKSLSYASSKIEMHYSKTEGRHIKARTNVERGDVLFVEKAFMFAPVFKENKEFHSCKCYNCLKDIISSIPCKLCTVCIYCDEKCRDLSWKRSHEWECNGMQANIWYDLGIAFPAFKVMLMGSFSGFKSLVGPPEGDLKMFGDNKDNYRYFNRLLSNISNNENLASYIVMSAVIISYLQKYTDFFSWFLKQSNCPKKESDSLMKYVGGVITKHIAQLACNSSTIEHWTSSSSDLLFPNELITVACGIFPSVSIMNHSCRPNVTNYFICDTIVVKALEDISQGDEILNCYGIDYRAMSREQRQYACRKLYRFDCKCVICLNPSKEIELLNSFHCLKCSKGLIPETSNVSSVCIDCGEKYDLEPFRKINNEAQKYLEKAIDDHQLEFLIRSLKLRETIMYKYHEGFEEIYYRLYTYYLENGDAGNMFKYFYLWLDNEKVRRGNNARGIGNKLYETTLAFLQCLQSEQSKNCPDLKGFLQNVECMIKEAKIILSLYYPSHITNRLSLKMSTT